VKRFTQHPACDALYSILVTHGRDYAHTNVNRTQTVYG
jgi:hypothetical protein